MTLYEDLEVYVELDGSTILAGRAYFHRNRGRLTSTTFAYDADYIAHETAYELDPALRLVSGSQQTPGLPGAFSDSAPDRWGRNLIMKRERALALQASRRPRTFDDADFLACVSDVTRQGALRFRPSGAPLHEFIEAGHDVPGLVALPELLRASDNASRESRDDDYEAVKALLAAGTGSLGGARPKAAVLDDDGRQLIAKFPHHGDGWDVMAWEATALDLAHRAGVCVAEHRLVPIAHQHVLLLDRFDRGPDGSRIGYMSAMTLLERRDGDSADYADIADLLAEVSASARADAHELFRRVAVSVGLNNTDDHLRNHGFLRARGGWLLSPAFDVNPDPDRAFRQTTIAGADSAEDEPAGLMELARSCRLTAGEARTLLDEVAAAIEDWGEVAASNGVSPAEIDRFADSFDLGLRTLRAA